MSYNAAVLLDPNYLITDYEIKKYQYSHSLIKSPEHTRDTYNFAFVAFLGVWYFSYGLILRKNLGNFKVRSYTIPQFGVLGNYISSFLVASAFHSFLLRRTLYGLSLPEIGSEQSSQVIMIRQIFNSKYSNIQIFEDENYFL